MKKMGFKIKKYNLISIILIFALIVSSLCGCKSNKGVESDGIYSFKNMNIEGALCNIGDFKMLHVGDNIVFYGANTSNEKSDTIEHFYYLNKDGEVAFNYNVNLHNGLFIDISISEAGDVYGLALIPKKPSEKDEALETTDKEDNKIDEKFDDPHTNSLFLEDKLGYSLFDRRYDEKIKAQEALKEAKAKEETVENEDENIDESYTEGMYEVYDESMDESYAKDMNEAYDESMEESYAENMGEAYDEEVMDDPYSIKIDINPKENTADFGPFNMPNIYGYSDEESGADGGATSVFDNYYLQLVKIDKQGNLIAQKDIFEQSEVEKLILDINLDYINTLAWVDDNIFIIAKGNIIMYDDDFNFNKIIKSDDVDENIRYASFVRAKNGELYGWYNDNNNYKDIYLAKVDLANGALGKPLLLKDESYNVRMSSGIDEDFSICKNGNLYGMNLTGDNEYKKIVDFMASDVPTDYINAVAGVDADHFYAVYRSIEDDSYSLAYFTKSNSNDRPKKTELIMAVVTSNYEIKKIVTEFNKKSEKYRIRLIDYNAMYGTNEYMADDTVLEKLNTDIIAGNMPDILLLDNSMPIQTYINKGLLEDLYPYFKNDKDISLSDYNDHIFKVFSDGDKMYQLVPSYRISTVLIKKSFVGDKTSWSVNEAMDIYKNSKAVAFFPFIDRNAVLEECMRMSGEQFINTKKGECNFNSDEFKDMLEFVNSFPTQMDFNSTVNKKLIDNFDNRYIDNIILCENRVFDSVNEYLLEKKGYFMEDITNIGFPTSSGNGSSIVPNLQISMSGISEHKEGCWEFLKYFLTDSYQNSIMSAFPVKNSSMDIIYENASKAPLSEIFYINGQKQSYEIKAYINGEEVDIEPLTDEEREDFKSFINSINTAAQSDLKVMNILKEECGDYFEGRATKDEVANRVQSRIQIYLYESQ